MPNHRVGVLLNDSVCSCYVHDTVRALQADESIGLILIQETQDNHPAGAPAPFAGIQRQEGLRQWIDSAVFAAFQKIEGKIASLLSKSIRRHFQKQKIDRQQFAETVTIGPPLSLAEDIRHYGEDDVRKVRQANLDIIVSCIDGAAYRGDILNASRLGIATLRLGDNRRTRGGPPAFWEVMERAPTTGFTIELADGESGQGTVLYRGDLVTRRTYTENVVQLYVESSPFLSWVVRQFLASGKAPRPEAKRPFAGRTRELPGFSDTAECIVKSIWLYGRMFVERKLLHIDQRWGVAYSRTFWADADLSKGTPIPNLRYRYFADPFAFKKDGKHYIFVEDYDFRTALGSISCIVVGEDGSYDIVEHILVEPFHLSFPFVFEDGGEIFMMPESHQGDAVRLYRCIEFPHKWQLDSELLKGGSPADTMLIKQQDKWYMLTNINQFHSDDHLSQMHVLWSNELRSGNWKRVGALPEVNSSLAGRNAGLLRGKNGEWFRVRQRQGFNQYGAGFSIARIKQLDVDGYAEETFAEIEPRFFEGLKGTHHMHGTGDFTVYDFVKLERYS